MLEQKPENKHLAQAVHSDLNWNTSIYGVYPNFQSIQNWQLAEGAWYTNSDETAGASLAVVG